MNLNIFLNSSKGYNNKVKIFNKYLSLCDSDVTPEYDKISSLAKYDMFLLSLEDSIKRIKRKKKKKKKR